MRPIMHFALAVILLLLILILPALAAPTNTITVCPLDCDYDAIQPAIDATVPGDTILIAAGIYTGQLTLKSDLTLTTQAGPTQTIVTASASPIIFGSNLDAVTIDGIGIQGNEAITAPIGIELISSTVVVSNVIVGDLHGANGAVVYTNGLSAIGLRISGTFSVTMFNSVIVDITGGDADFNSDGRGGDSVGISANGDGYLSVISSTVRMLAGGAAGMKNDWTVCFTCCNGAGGRSLGISTEGAVHLDVKNSRIENLTGGQPCAGDYGPSCRWNAGEVIGVRAISGTLNLNNSAITGLHEQTSYTNAPSTGVATSHSAEVHIIHTEIAELNTLTEFMAVNQPASPYCPPPPSSAVGIASHGDKQVQIAHNNLRDIIGIGLDGYSTGISADASQVITLTGNRIIRLSGGTHDPWWIPLGVYQVRGIEVSAVGTAIIKDNRIEQLRGGDGGPLYVYSSSGGGTVGIHLESTTYSRVINNIITILVGGRADNRNGIWAPYSYGGDSIGINLRGGLSEAWNNTIYDLRGGQGGQPNSPSGTSVGLLAANAAALIVNNAFISNTIGVSMTSAASYVWDYNALWRNTLNYTGVVTGPHDVFADPWFVDAANGDFHLPFSSPLIDAGFDLGAPLHDFEGTPRPLDGNNDGIARTDIGAHEHQPVPLNTVFLPITLAPQQ